jgi:hypothetical protein
MTTLTYEDAYLARFCTEEREDRAFDEVDQYGTFSTAWRNKLTVIRCYILACLENQADPEDLFSAKLTNYRKEFEFVLAQARAATPDAEGIIPPILSVPLERA